jgi:hypothetical protein
MDFCEWFDQQSLGLKIILLIPFWGWAFSGLYRIFKYIKSKNVVTLIIGILCFFAFGTIVSIIDIVTEAISGKISILAD